jgi:CRP-like cAMP-binding protein
MYIQDSELFKGLSEHIMTELPKIMLQETHGKGAVLYGPSDKAESFYILQEGCVRLSIGQNAEVDYTVNRPGESFGWSCLVDRGTYVSEATCIEPTKLVKIDKNELDKVLGKHPETGMFFYKQLAKAVMQRLIYNYQTYISEGSLRGVTSFGTGQLMGPED